MVVNDEHPFSSINLHWYYNPVTDLIEPTIRESFVNKISNKENNFKSILNNNKILFDFSSMLGDKLDLANIFDDLIKIKELILNDNEYFDFKSKLSGFKNFIDEREKLILNNINQIEKSLRINTKKEIIVEEQALKMH